MRFVARLEKGPAFTVANIRELKILRPDSIRVRCRLNEVSQRKEIADYENDDRLHLDAVDCAKRILR